MAALTGLLGLGPPPPGSAPLQPPIPARDYLVKLRKYLGANLSRLAPPLPGGGKRDASWLQQSYTILTLGLDPSSAPLSQSVKIPLTLGFASPQTPARTYTKPLLLRLPPDKLLYLLLRWQSLPQNLPHVGQTDVPVPPGVAVAARGAQVPRATNLDGDVESVRSWAGSIRTVSMGTLGKSEGGFGWFSKPKEVDEDKILLELYSIFNTLPRLLIHPPFGTDSQIEELLDAGGYTSLGGVDVRVPLDVLRNLQVLELDSFDPRGLLVPRNALLHSLTVHDIGDADDWIEELLVDRPPDSETDSPEVSPRFPNLRFLSLHHTSMLAFPSLPLTSITHLDLSHNLLNSIPDALSELHNLVSLNLSNNLIAAVRNAPAALGNLHTLNLARNRIDCLVGLDRVLGLRRVDVRGNALTEPGEVGRLAVLPHIEAVWAAENPLTSTEDWRAEIAAAFIGESTEPTIDDTPLAWSERRKVDAILAARGRRKAERSEARPSLNASTSTKHSSRPSTPPSQLIPTPTSRVVSPPSPSPTPSKVKKTTAAKKRARRRVVNFEGERSGSDTPNGKNEEGPAVVKVTGKKGKKVENGENGA